MYCKGCRKEFDANFNPICPYCGVDSRNPIECNYSESERFLIKNYKLYGELLIDLDPLLFLIEKMDQKVILKEARYHVEGNYSVPLREYCKNYYGHGHLEELIDLKYDSVKKELNQKFSHFTIPKSTIEFALYAAFLSIAKKQNIIINFIMRNREDYDYLLKRNIGNDYLWDSRIELRKIKEETVKQWKKNNITI